VIKIALSVMFMPFSFELRSRGSELNFASISKKNETEPEASSIPSLCLVRFCQGHVSSHVPAVTSRPTNHTSERDDDGRSELGQAILDSDGVRSHDAPSD
jgi:hypothetical protein